MAAAIEIQLRTYLAALSPPLPCEARIYPQVLPSNPTYPAVTYERISALRYRSITGLSGYARPRLRYHCWSTSYDGAKALAHELIGALDGFAGLVGNIKVGAVSTESETDLYDDAAEPGAVDGVHRVVVDFLVGHQEAL